MSGNHITPIRNLEAQSFEPAAATTTTAASWTLNHDYAQVSLSIVNTHATVAFDVLNCDVQMIKDGAWETMAAGSDTASALKAPYISENATTLAAGASAMIVYNVYGAYATRVQISGNGAASASIISGVARAI